MSYKILADTFSVARDASHFVQIKTLKNPNTTDEVWVTFKVEGDTKYARATMQTLLDTLEETFFDHFESDAYDRFENALKEINLTFRQLEEKRGASAMGNISAILAIFSGNNLHLTQCGEGEAYLVRKGKLSMVSEGLASKSPDLFVNIASGELMPEDKIIFSTSRLLRLATHNQLAQMCSEGVVEAMDSLREVALSDSELTIGIACLSTKLAHRPGGREEEGERTPGKLMAGVKGAWSKAMGFLDNKKEASEAKFEGRKPPMQRSTILMILGILILLLIVSVTFLINRSHKSEVREEYRQRIEQLTNDISSANTKGYANDKVTANAILDRVQIEANKILETEYYRTEVLALLEKAQNTRDSINNAQRLGEVQPYADLAAKSPNVEAVGILGLEKDLYAYEYNSLLKVVLDQVMDPRAISESEVIVKATVMEDENALIFMSQSGQILEFFEDAFQSMNTADEAWKKAVDLDAYGNFLYLLSPQSNQIYKYTRSRTGYSAATEYSLDADLKEAVAMAIDGNIYVLKKGGEIIKIFKGEQQTDFKVDAQGVDLAKAKDLFTLPEQKHLYIFDPENKRVVILTKPATEEETTAVYQKQIYFDKLTDVVGLYVPVEEKEMYLISKKAIYKVEL